MTTLVLLGRYLEVRARSHASRAIRSLLEVGAKDATVLRDGREILVPVAEVSVGDRFLVRPGEKIATDGVVVEGEAGVDMSMLTGESAAGADRPGRRRRRGHRRHRWPARRARNANRLGHRAGADRSPRRRGSVRQGLRAEARRPDLGRVRARGDVPVPAYARRLAPLGRGGRAGVHRRGVRPDCRLPLRARPRHAHCASGRHRTRRAARRPDPGAAGAREHAPGRHDRPRQDRDCDRRPSRAHRRCTS